MKFRNAQTPARASSPLWKMDVTMSFAPVPCLASKGTIVKKGNQEMTLEEIGERLDLTRERVRQIKEKAIRKLKKPSASKLLKTYLG